MFLAQVAAAHDKQAEAELAQPTNTDSYGDEVSPTDALSANTQLHALNLVDVLEPTANGEQHCALCCLNSTHTLLQDYYKDASDKYANGCPWPEPQQVFLFSVTSTTPVVRVAH